MTIDDSRPETRDAAKPEDADAAARADDAGRGRREDTPDPHDAAGDGAEAGVADAAEGPVSAPTAASPPPETEAPAEEDPSAALAAALAERDELRDRLMRALADTENLRKRAERDVKDAEAYAGTKLARDVLTVHDNLSRALEVADDDARAAAGALVEGVELTLRDLIAAFQKHRIEQVSPEVGDRFDPKLHQAMFEAPAPGAAPGTVIQVMQVGFTISGRLLRPAMVGVAAAAPADG